MGRLTHSLAVAISMAFSLAAYPAQAQTAADQNDSDQDARFAAFEQLLTGATFTGKFTVVGSDPDKLHEESYFIRRVRKLDEGNLWNFVARIKYGDHDVTVPMPLEVLWAGNTPVITVDNVDIPGFGSVSARVVVHNGKYAGTWTHGKAHGHLFGTISKPGDTSKADAGDAPDKG